VTATGPTRYRKVVLTSWDRRMNDCEHNLTRIARLQNGHAITQQNGARLTL